MIPMKGPRRDGAHRLGEIYRSLDEGRRRTLLAFGEFLAAQGDDGAAVLELPEPLPRPASESVVGAIRRLSRTYHMLDRSNMLNETSSLMAAHVIKGRPAPEVIDELEALFGRHYAQYREERET